MINPFDILLLTAYMINYGQFTTNNRRYLLFFRLVSNGLLVIYFLSIGTVTAAAASFTAMTAASMQAAFPDHLLSKTVFLRTVIALSIATVGLALGAENANSALPIIGCMIARISEVQSCTQRIRMGLLASQTCWVVYAINAGLVVLCIADTLALLLNLTAIWKFEQERKRVPSVVPVEN